MEGILVGEGNINKIAEILDHECLRLGQKWQDVAGILGITLGETTIWSQNLQLGHTSFRIVLCKVLTRWSGGKDPAQANLKVVYDALKRCEIKSVADSLQSEFAESLSSPTEMLIPPSEAYYISRTISIPSGRVNPDIFKEQNNDKFLISGLDSPGDRVRLTNLAGKDGTDVSGNQLWNVTARFIKLECDSHYDAICMKTSENVHWFHHDNGEYYWRKSSGGFALIREFVENENLTEEKYVNRVLGPWGTTPTCIAALSGMGKTSLLISIARQVEQTYSDRKVLFNTLQEFLTNPPILPSDEFKLELFLDGYDELHPNQASQAHVLFESLKQRRNTRFHITTRSHMKTELERNLGVVSYNIQPFNYGAQVQFLKKIWVNEHQALDNALLDTFTEKCLQNFKRVLVGETDTHISETSVLLHLTLIAEVFSVSAVAYSNGNSSTIPKDIYPINDLYHKFIERRFLNFSFTPYDVLLAEGMYATFPQWMASSPSCIQYPIEGIDPSTIYSAGLMEPSSSRDPSPKFVHRSFAEYLTAQHLAKQLKLKCRECSQLIFGTIFGQCKGEKVNVLPRGLGKYELEVHRFKYPMISNFLEGFLEKDGFEVTDLTELTPPESMTNPYEALSACVTSNLPKCFELVRDAFNVQLDAEQSKSLVLLASLYSDNRRMMELVTNLVEGSTFRNINELDYPRIYSEYSLEIMLTPLHLAMAGGRYSVVEFLLLKNYSLFAQETKWYSALHYSGCFSMSDSPSIVNDKCDIIRLISATCKSALHERYPSWNNPTPLLQKRVHPRLIKCLVEQGADINATDKWGNTVLHTLASWDYPPSMYTEVLQFVLENGFNLLHHRNKEGKTALHQALVWIELEDLSLQLFAAYNADFNSRDNGGNAVLHTSIQCRSSEFTKKLIQNPDYGCNLTRNSRGQGALHIAAYERKYELIRFLIGGEWGVNVNERDSHMKTPLHSALERGNNGLVQGYLIEHGANLESTNNQGRIPLVHAMKQSEVTLTIEIVTKMMEKGLNIEKYGYHGIQAILQQTNGFDINISIPPHSYKYVPMMVVILFLLVIQQIYFV